MKIRFASALLALALPLCAQDPTATDPTESVFYKAFYLEKGQRDFVGAMALYEQFLNKAPEHKLAAEAAKQQFQLLDRTGKTKERDAFKAKYEKLLGNIAAAPASGGAGAGGDRPARGEGGERPARGEGAGPGAGRMDPAARIAELEKQLEKAKADGKEEDVKRLTAQIERAKAGGGRGPGGQGGQGGRRGGLMSLLGPDAKKIADMSDEELGTLKEALGNSGRMVEMVRSQDPDRADKLEKGVADLTKALEAGNKEEAQKVIETIKAAMPQMGGRGRGRGGEGGGAGGAGGGGGGARPAGGGGGGGTSNGGGGGGR
ncbi:MAG: hypothetical protein JNK15_06470 [Planctomycetes bacterium]|nr:hypothetical protein [Planctomycetota bacterium]